MKKLLEKAGYVSIEVVVVAGIILLAGLIAVTKFVATGKDATKKSNQKITDTLTNAGQTNYDE